MSSAMAVAVAAAPTRLWKAATVWGSSVGPTWQQTKHNGRRFRRDGVNSEEY